MEKLNYTQKKLICELLKSSPDKNTTQHILNKIGTSNWDRKILGNCIKEHLTSTQSEIFESFGGLYSHNEMLSSIEDVIIEYSIVEKLKESGVDKYLYENPNYIEDIKNRTIIVEGINMDDIKRELIME